MKKENAKNEVVKEKLMTMQDIKQAGISLVLGVITMAISSLVLGGLDIFKGWMFGLGGGAITTLRYLSTKNLV